MLTLLPQTIVLHAPWNDCSPVLVACIASEDLAALGVVARIGDKGGDGTIPARGPAAAATSCHVLPRGRPRVEVPQARGRLLRVEGPQGALLVSFARACVARSLPNDYNGLPSLVYLSSTSACFLKLPRPFGGV